MDKRRGLGALVGAGLLAFAAAGSALAVPPTYAISVSKTANPDSVPVGGADVTFTVWVHNTGSGDLHTVTFVESMVGCTLAFSSGDSNSNSILDNGETWSYTCTVAGVTPDTQNSVTVNACHNNSDCNQAAHDATGQASVTVLGCEVCATEAPTEAPTEPPSAAPTAAPTGGAVPDTNAPSEPPTDTLMPGGSAPSDSAWFLVVAVGVLLASLAVLRPSRASKPN